MSGKKPHKSVGKDLGAIIIDNPRKAEHFIGEIGKQNSKGSLDFAKAEIVGREGLVPDYLSFRNSYWGQMTPTNYAILRKAYLEDPIIKGAINVTAEAIMGDGWEFRGGIDLHRNRLEKVMKKNAWNETIFSIVLELLIYGDAYLELVRETDRKKFYCDVDGPVIDEKRLLKGDFSKGYAQSLSGVTQTFQTEKDYYSTFVEEYLNKPKGMINKFFPTDASTIKIDYNEHGEVIKYIQRVLHRRVDFYPDEMIHFALYKFGGRVYGNTSLASVLFTLQAKQTAENYTTDYFRRGALPRVIYIVKSNFSEEQLKRFTDKLKTLAPWMDLVLTGDIETKEIAPSNTDLQFRELLQYMRENVLMALQVPPALLPIGTMKSGKSSDAQVQMEAFDRHVRSLKMAICNIINNQLFTEENFGFDDVEFTWTEQNTREDTKKVQMAQLLAGLLPTGIIAPSEIRQKYLDLPEMSPEQLAEVEQYKVDQLQQQMQQSVISGMGRDPAPGEKGKPAGKAPWAGNNRNEFALNPTANQDRKENAERNNTERQMENKFLKDIEQYARQLMASMRNSNLSPGTQDDARRVGENVEANLHEEGREQQGSITRHSGPEPNVTTAAEQINQRQVYSPVLYNTDSAAKGKENESRYPLGATPILDERTKTDVEYVNERKEELVNIANNPVGNAYSLNTDRVFPLPGEKDPSSGDSSSLTHSVTDDAVDKDPERDEVNAAGRTVWAASDKEDGKKKPKK